MTTCEGVAKRDTKFKYGIYPLHGKINPAQKKSTAANMKYKGPYKRDTQGPRLVESCPNNIIIVPGISYEEKIYTLIQSQISALNSKNMDIKL